MGFGSRPTAIQIDACVSKQVLSLSVAAESPLRPPQDWRLAG